MNNKSLFERINNVKNRGPEKWLSRSLREEDDHLDKGRKDSDEIRKRVDLNKLTDRQKDNVQNQIDTTFGIKKDDAKRTPKRKDPSGSELADKISGVVGKKTKVSHDPSKEKQAFEVKPDTVLKARDEKGQLQLPLAPQPPIDTPPTKGGLDEPKKDELKLSQGQLGIEGIDMSNPNLDSQEHEDARYALEGKAQELFEQMMQFDESTQSSVDDQMAGQRGILKKLVELESKKNGSFDAKRAYARLIALGMTYEGRRRGGKGARSMNYEQIQQLNSNAENLKKEHGEGTPEQIKEMINNRMLRDVPMDMVEELWKMMPSKTKQVFGGGKAVGIGSLPYLDEEGNETLVDFSNQHFQGLDEAGNAIRGPHNANRAKLQLKRFLDQGGIDPYTGLPLTLDRIELDHVRAIQNPNPGEDRPRAADFPFREHPDNWLFADAGVNSKKDNLSMGEFLDQQVIPHKDKPKEDYGDLKQIQDAGDVHDSSMENLIKTMLFDDNGHVREGTSDNVLDELEKQEKALRKTLKDQGITQKARLVDMIFKNYRGGAKGRKLTREQTGNKEQFSTPKGLRKELIQKLMKTNAQDQDKIADGWNGASLTAQKRVIEMLEQNSPDLLRNADGTVNRGGSYGKIFTELLGW